MLRWPAMVLGISMVLAASLCAQSTQPATAPAMAPTTQEDAMTPAPTPSPDQKPEDVVRIQLTAMQHNDDPSPDAGIATAFKFASPQNREHTGPLDRFIRMVKTPEYAGMLNYKSAEFGQVHMNGGEAQQLVKITAATGEVALFVFILHQQADGQYKDCWMTDGVVRLRPEDIVPAPAKPAPGTNGDGHDRA